MPVVETDLTAEAVEVEVEVAEVVVDGYWAVMVSVMVDETLLVRTLELPKEGKLLGPEQVPYPL